MASIAKRPDGTYRPRYRDENGKELAVLRGHTAWVTQVVFSPDGKRLASASDDESIKIWDLESYRETADLKGHADAVNWIAFSPDGKRLVSAGSDDYVKVWDLAAAKDHKTLKGHEGTVNSVALYFYLRTVKRPLVLRTSAALSKRS